LLCASALLARPLPAVAAGALEAGCSKFEPTNAFVTTPTLDVLTLNVGHARGTAVSQLLVTRGRHQRNLDAIAALLTRTAVDVVALQEADAPSWWSGRFDHVAFLSEATNFGCTVHGHHAESWLYSFGAALLSRHALVDTDSHTFHPSPPTPNKGFVRATVYWRAAEDAAIRPVTLVSVHLDFSRRQVRNAQIAEMVESLSGLSTPLIVLGDFNEDWTLEDSAVRRIVREFGMRAFTPTASELGTYKRVKRLDWILISEELEFVDYAVLPDAVSDHRALFARIGWAGDD
jgi:endonuclease/exonuclease/phosphatase family metal-dependent hydrolase